MKSILDYETVALIDDDDALEIIDQTLLPGRTEMIRLHTAKEIWDAIYLLQVRGAPAIGVTAGMGLYLQMKHSDAGSYEDFMKELEEKSEYLNSSRPTAVNLSWALKRMLDVMDRAYDEDPDLHCHDAKKILLEEAKKIHQEDVDACMAMGEYGLELLESGMGILTHCNAGTIATSKYGTCLAPIHLGQERGYGFRVFCDETRPLLQGARLTAWELHKNGVDTTLICDNMASIAMKNGWINAVVVGCDRMAANGDGANKIGTSGVAILAHEYGIPFYMFVPTSTIDLDTPTGDDIPIEQRDGNEIREMWYEKPMAPAGVKTYNPAFDVTDHKYITAVVTEKGIVRPPYDVNLRKLFEE